MPVNRSAYTLLDATITLFPADAAGAPITSAPMWWLEAAKDLHLAGPMRSVQTTPGGARWPVNHPLVQTHEITLSGEWILPEAAEPDFQAGKERYVLDILWQETFPNPPDANSPWRRRTYYGVTARQDDLQSVGERHFNRPLIFDAQYYIASAGTGTPPSLSGELPYVVRWVSATEFLDLYDYSASAFLFTERTAGQAVSRATITTQTVTPFDETLARFSVNGIDLTGATTALKAGAAGFEAENFFEGVPVDADLPRLDFLYNNQRVASVSAAGVFYADTLIEATPVAGTARYQLKGAAALQATLASGDTTANLMVEA